MVVVACTADPVCTGIGNQPSEQQCNACISYAKTFVIDGVDKTNNNIVKLRYKLEKIMECIPCCEYGAYLALQVTRASSVLNQILGKAHLDSINSMEKGCNPYCQVDVSGTGTLTDITNLIYNTIFSS